MALVLCSGVDLALMNTRKLIIESVGHRVVLGIGEPGIASVCKKHKFDVAVIGQAITTKEKKHIMALIRQHCPSAKILELYPSYEGKVLEDADSWLEVPVNIPARLAETVTALAAESRGKS